MEQDEETRIWNLLRGSTINNVEYMDGKIRSISLEAPDGRMMDIVPKASRFIFDEESEEVLREEAVDDDVEAFLTFFDSRGNEG